MFYYTLFRNSLKGILDGRKSSKELTQIEGTALVYTSFLRAEFEILFLHYSLVESV